MNPIFFDSPGAFRLWLRANHAQETEVWVGYHKKATGRPSLTWSQAVDEALCYGWIDGIVKSLSAEAHMQRFTPRRPTSIWSDINVAKVAALTAAGRMRAAGLKAFAARDEKRSSARRPRRGSSGRRSPTDIAAPRCIGSRAPSGPRHAPDGSPRCSPTRRQGCGSLH
jgi:uncharacterized protein YdeI (YjbR/CyaY-like superfamily)